MVIVIMNNGTRSTVHGPRYSVYGTRDTGRDELQFYHFMVLHQFIQLCVMKIGVIINWCNRIWIGVALHGASNGHY